MPTLLDAAGQPVLQELAERLRELAGDSAFQAGLGYLRQGRVKDGSVAGTTAYATVTGSTDYRVSVAFADRATPSCTCPAHRRRRFCKHVVALCRALLERPGDFSVREVPPEIETPRLQRRRVQGARTPARGAEDERATLRTAGLEAVDRLLGELTGGGLMILGPDKAEMVANAGELVRALKLRRLGNLVLELEAAVSGADGGLQGDRYSHLLMDLWFTRAAVGAHLEGRIALDPRWAEELLGKTWREEELESVAGLELVELAYTVHDSVGFHVETSYLIDVVGGHMYAEKQIAPIALAPAPKPRRRHRLLVEEAGIYPGLPPQRIRLSRVKVAPLRREDVGRALAAAPTTLPDVRAGLAERLEVPFGQADVAVLFRPASLLVQAGTLGALDEEGRFLALDCPRRWAQELPALLPEAGGYAVFGHLELDRRGPRMRGLSVVSPGLRWSRGPVYPDVP